MAALRFHQRPGVTFLEKSPLLQMAVLLRERWNRALPNDHPANTTIVSRRSLFYAPGGGVLPYVDVAYTGMCRWTAGFWPLCPKQGI